ncbi:MAG: DUF1223 domain-containing protein [Hyphomicrobiales bacterium]|nr:DUF1223 domain-containing protein [Hyphomicrobiales bacterium]
MRPTPLFGALVGFAAVAGVPPATEAAAAETPSAERPLAVVELFTSQGCANCPPADALLGELTQRADLVTLSYAVDYWDYLGWKDTAAKPEFTARQKAYASRRGDRDVYTPQVVVNGEARLVGSDRAAIRREIAEGDEAARPLAVAIELEAGSEALKVRLPEAEPGVPAHATVWLARFDETKTVTIGRGENTGRSVTYSHLVRSLQPIGMWKGKALTIELPRQEGANDPNHGCAVLVQADKGGLPGRILGARICSRPNG